MFKLFGKAGKIELSKKISDLSVEASEQFLNYLKEDLELYSKCINENPIRITSMLFMINIYRDILNSKYNADDVFSVVYTTIMSLSPNEKSGELFMKSFNEYMKSCNEATNYYKQFSQFDITEVLTKVFFGLVIDDREYIQNELEESIPKTSSFKKIYSYIDGVLKHTNILNEEYKLRLK